MAEAVQGSIQSVRRALQVLGEFTPNRPQWTVSDLARITGLHKSVVARLLATMALDGFVIQDSASRAYTIGPQAFAIGNVYGPYLILERIARPIMQGVTGRCNHACTLGIPVDHQFMYLIVVESPRSAPLRVTIEVGGRRPYHVGAVGKVLLANMPRDRACALLGDGPLQQQTPFTIVSVDLLLAELDDIRRTGIAISSQEAVVGVGAVAAAVTNANGACVAGLNIVYPIHLVSEQEIGELAHLTVAAAGQISQRLGGFTM